MILPAIMGATARRFDPDTVLLLPMTGANNSTTFTDIARGGNAPHTVTPNGDAKISTAVADPFSVSGGVGTFDGSGDYLSIPANPDHYLNSGGNTFECWCRFASGARTELRGLFCRYLDDSNWLLVYYHTNSGLGIYYKNSSATAYFIEQGSVTGWVDQTWYHVAVSSADGKTWRVYRDGTQLGAGTLAKTPPDMSATTTTIAKGGQGAIVAYKDFHGQMSDVCITRRAKYTANFTPPARLKP